MSGIEEYIPVYCPGADGPCGRYLVKVCRSHHSLVSPTCPKCGSQWRVFHNANADLIEIGLAPSLPDSKVEALVQITRGPVRLSQPQGA